MLYPRIIPCLLISNKGLVKTTKFKDAKYVGDPINAVKIFNEKQADELMVLDIDATTKNQEPDYAMIENLAKECRMPLCYGGGIKTVSQAKKIFSLGVEKISVSSAAIDDPKILCQIAEQVGTQSVVVVLDVRRKRLGGYSVWTHNATKKSNHYSLIDILTLIQDIGVGEIVINCIDYDGTMCGYDLNLVKHVRSHIKVPMTVLGGAGSLDDITVLIKNYSNGIIGAAAGSLFVFKGKYRAVLINYPSINEKSILMQQSDVSL